MMAEPDAPQDPIRLLRAPVAAEAVTVTGWALAEAIRVVLGGNPHLDTPGIHAALERLERYELPIPAQIAPYHPIMLPDGGFQDGMEWCLPDSWVNVMVPDVEGIPAYFGAQGISATSVGIERRFVDMLEDPGSTWPWTGPDLGRLIDLLGLEPCSSQTA